MSSVPPWKYIVPPELVSVAIDSDWPLRSHVPPAKETADAVVNCDPFIDMTMPLFTVRFPLMAVAVAAQVQGAAVERIIAVRRGRGRVQQNRAGAPADRPRNCPIISTPATAFRR